jgi:hypothetical protein
MQMAIRALGWATKLLWIIVLAIIITIAYSVTQISIAFGESTTTVTGQMVTISLPINIRNAGLYDLTQLNITTQITDQYGHSLIRNSTFTQIISRGMNATVMHTITLNITKILDENSTLLFNDTTFTTFQYVTCNYANAIPFVAYANQTMPWGAPLSNLAVDLGNSTLTPYNTTYSIATVRLYFENHNQYIPVTGMTRIEIYSSTDDTLVSTGTANVNAQPHTPCDIQMDVLVSNSRTVSAGDKVHVFFETSAFDYGPVMMSFG